MISGESEDDLDDQVELPPVVRGGCKKDGILLADRMNSQPGLLHVSVGDHLSLHCRTSNDCRRDGDR